MLMSCMNMNNNRKIQSLENNFPADGESPYPATINVNKDVFELIEPSIGYRYNHYIPKNNGCINDVKIICETNEDWEVGLGNPILDFPMFFLFRNWQSANCNLNLSIQYPNNTTRKEVLKISTYRKKSILPEFYDNHKIKNQVESKIRHSLEKFVEYGQECKGHEPYYLYKMPIEIIKRQK